MLRNALLLVAVLAFAGTAFGAVTFYYNDRPGFDAAVAGMTLDSSTDFEELGVPPGSLVCYPVPPGLAPPQITANMRVSSTYPDPSCGLVALGAGFVGNATTVVGPNYFAGYGQYQFAEFGGYYAAGFDLMDPIAPGHYPVVVYDMGGAEIARTTVNFPMRETFMGVVSDQLIGMIELQSTGGDLTDNWELYIPEPSALALLALGGLLLRRR